MVAGRKGWGLVVAAALTLLAATSALAAPQKIDLGEKKRLGGFHRAVGQSGGKSAQELTAAESWEIERQGFLYYRMAELSGLDMASGSLEITVRRTARVGYNYYPVVEFEDDDGGFALQVLAQWDDTYNPGQSVLYITADKPISPRQDVWGDRVRLPRYVEPGEEVTLLLTWGKGPGENRIYMDGQEALSYSVPLEKLGRKPADSPRAGSMAALLAKARWMVVPDYATIVGIPDDILTLRKDTEVKMVTLYPTVISPVTGDVAVASVAHDASRIAGFSGKLVAGNTMTVTVEGTPGAAATFDIVHFPGFDRRIALDWRGWGVYLERKVFLEEGEVDLRDVEGYRVYASTAPFDPLAAGFEPVKELEVDEQSYLLENLEIDTPYYVAVVAEMRDGTLRPVIAPIAGRAMAESAPGVYAGAFVVGYRDRYPRAVAVGHLAKGSAVSSLAGDSKSAFAVDPALTIAVATEPKELKADEKSVSKVTVTVTDANGNPVSGHKVRFLLATTSQYTGVVGGGAFAEQVGGSMKESAFGETDLFGRLTSTYVAGFAAKTAVIVARDMASNDTGAGYVKTFIQTAAELELEPVVQVASMMDAAYQITVTSSDEWLTADGKSQARITARVTLGGKPVEGHKVDFEASPGAGSIRVVQGTTGRDGEARAVFTAGRKIGIALIRATDLTVGISGSVAIELRSDAPAKIAIKFDPEKLPADGRSRAELTVLVTDVNDNPNEGTVVEYAITSGGGKLKDDKGLTDRRGESTNTYTAGRSPGKVAVGITVRSTEPTDEEIVKARGLAVAVSDTKFF